MKISWISLTLQKRIVENVMHLIFLNNHLIAWKESEYCMFSQDGTDNFGEIYEVSLKPGLQYSEFLS